MSSILLTGGGGLVGADLLSVLVAEGHALTVISRTRPPISPSVQWIPADLGGEFEVPVSDPVDVVIHNAACLHLGKTESERTELYKVNERASHTLIRWALDHGVKAFIFTSTLSQVARPLPDCITEQSPVAPTTYYAQTKHAVEQLLLSAADQGAIKSLIFRISSPLSPSGVLPHNVIGTWIKLAKKGSALPVFGSGLRTQDFVSTKDIASAFSLAIKKPASGIYNIASSYPLSMVDAATIIGKVFDVSIERGGLDPGEDERWNISIEKARQTFGYEPTSTGPEMFEAIIRRIKTCKR